MSINITDFDKIWASTSPLTPYSFSDANYKRGWDFVGSTPPSRQMWDFLQKQNDEKSQYLLNNFDNYLPLSGGTLTGDVLGVTPPNGDNSKKLANTEFIQALANIIAPVGCVQAFAGSTTPQGWLLCDGSAVSRTDYADLYAVIGTTYGDGDGSTTFNVPNLIDKFVEGSAIVGTVRNAGLPNITGELITRATSYNVSSIISTANGAFSLDGNDSGQQDPVTQSSGQVDRKKVKFNASASSSIYGNSATVQPPAVTMRYVIKY